MNDDPKSNGKITLLVSEDGATIELKDTASTLTFVKIKLTAEQFCKALSRVACTPCKFEVHGIDCIGKEMHMDDLVFEMPEHDFKDRKQVACQEAKRVCPPGWTPDLYFGSQSSFLKQDGKQFARTKIRKWE